MARVESRQWAGSDVTDNQQGMQNSQGIEYALPLSFSAAMTACTALGSTCTQGDGAVPYCQLLALGQLSVGLICVEPNKILITFY